MIMYPGIDVSTIIPAAEEFVMTNDRSLYEPFFKTAEKFCASNDVLIGGKTAGDLAAGRPLNKDSFFWELFCESTYVTARKLANMLACTDSIHVPARTTELQTNIKHLEFTIFINARMLFKIYSIRQYRGVKMAEIMTLRTTGYFGNSIKCISNELLLIDIYRQLYSPSRLADWKLALDTEPKLFVLPSRSGGAEDAETICTIKNRFLQNIPSDAVIIGDYAIALMTKSVQMPNKIQIISEITADNLITILGGNGNLKSEKHCLNVPSDFQIKKYTIYATDGASHTPIIEVFNSSKFEMIPWRLIQSRKVGNPWVLLRFIFIDIWIIRVVMKITGKDMNKRMLLLYANASSLRNSAFSDLPATFQLTNYTGKYINEQTAKKKLIKEIGERYAPYYPARMNTCGTTVTGSSDEITVPISTKLDFSSDYAMKQKILRKVTGINRKINEPADIMNVLYTFSRQPNLSQPDWSGNSKWGQGKSTVKFFLKNAVFLPFISEYLVDNPVVNNNELPLCLDVGCGDGTDLVSLRTKYDIKCICADISDTRSDNSEEFIIVTPGLPLDLPDATIDIVFVFHCIHHMIEDVSTRLRDIIRVTKPGGLILIKDHNITNSIEASNVDLEHLAYMVPGKSIPALVRDFRTLEPMIYYPRDTIHGYMIGCKLLHTEIISAPTCIYASIFKKL